MDNFPQLINREDQSTIPIDKVSFSIGRHLMSDLVIDHMGISRNHCLISKINDKWTLRDRSTNGTLVNGKIYKLNQTVVLNEGDIIKLTNNHLEYIFTLARKTSAMTETKDIESASQNSSSQQNDPEVEECLKDFVPELSQPLVPDLQSGNAVATGTAAEVANNEKLHLQDNGGESHLQQEHAKVDDDEPPAKISHTVELVENELTCSICSELFVKAVTLTCSHTFCKFCIEQWKHRNKSFCPICRQPMRQLAPTLVLDNLIERVLESASEEVRKNRKEMIQQRKTLMDAGIIRIKSDSEEEELPELERLSDDDIALSNSSLEAIGFDSDDLYDPAESGWYDEDDGEEDDDDDDDFDFDHVYDGEPGRYYGGYGRCYICNRTGHWANGCPDRATR